MDRERDAGISAPAVISRAEDQPADSPVALAVAPHDPATNRRAGYQLGRGGRWGEALVCWGRVVAAEPDDLEGWYSLGLAASHAGDEARAREALDRLLAAN